MSVGKSYSAGQAAKAAGIAYHQLNHWAMKGVVEPSIDYGEGYGGVREYSFQDVVALRIVAMMKRSGLSLESLKPLVHKIQAWSESSTKTLFVSGPNRRILTFEEHEDIPYVDQGLVWFVSIKKTADDVRKLLSESVIPKRGKACRVT